MNEKIQKLRRILAEGSWSSENEKKIARSILEKYKAMGIDVDAAFEERVMFRAFPFRWGSRNSDKVNFLITIIRNFIEPKVLKGRTYVSHSSFNVEFELTESEHAEALARFEFYWRDYSRQKKENDRIFRRAYVNQNKLWTIPEEDKKNTPPSKELMDLDMKAMFVQSTIEKAEYLKRVGSPKK